VLARAFRRLALRATVATSGLAIAGLALSELEAPRLFHGLTHRGLPAVIVGLAAFSATIEALQRDRDRAARAAIIIAVTALVWGWGLAQFPRLIGAGVTVQNAAAPSAELHAVAIALAAGALLLLPSLWLLYVAFRRYASEVHP
jgi:cytochrome d ubiquinol oxidase subunit II